MEMIFNFMQIPECSLSIGVLPLFIISAFNTVVFLIVIIAMIFVLSRFYRSNITSYQNRILAMGQQVKDMQQHLDYTSREETKARTDAKRAAEARDTLLTSISHEIRTPMNGILGMAILLEETDMNPEQKDYIDTIISSGKVLLNKVDEVISNDMVEQSKIGHLVNTSQLKSIDLRNAVEEVIDTFAVRASEKNVELLYEIAEELPQQVLLDNKRLKQVLTNLVENVMEDNLQVYIGVQLLKHATADASSNIGFTVSVKPLGHATKIVMLLKSGTVLPDRDPEDEYAKELGLAISKKLVEEMNGEIRTVSEIAHSFIFSIPFEAAAMSKHVTEAYNLKDFEDKQVLIVNSNQSASEIFKKQLLQWKLQPIVVANARQALQMAAVQTFNLVITEMNLPEMSGIELADQLRETFPQLPVILLNHLNDNRYKEYEKVAGSISVLNKPVKQHNLFDNILSNLLQVNKATQGQDISVKNLSESFAKKYPMRILVAEDNRVNQKWAIKILSKLGYQADIAENGHEALDMTGKTTYDLVLMDVQMPEMDGLEATKLIRACLTRQPAIIAMTANVMHGDRIACMQAGMNDYISKPVQLGELVNMLEKWALVIADQKAAEQIR